MLSTEPKLLSAKGIAQSVKSYQPKIRERQYAVSSRQQENRRKGADKTGSSIHRRDAEYAKVRILPDRQMTIGQKALGLRADKFLFVVVSRQTKKTFFLCVNLRGSAVNKS